MVLRGRVEKGNIVFDEPVSLPEGVRVRVETLESSIGTDGFWTSLTVDELAVQQSVRPSASFAELLGGWPESELDDGFEEAVAHWRAQDGKHGP